MTVAFTGEADGALTGLLKEWTQEQHRLSRLAIWQDRDLSFQVPAPPPENIFPSPCPSDFLTPKVGKVYQEQRKDEIWKDLRWIGGLDISFRNDSKGRDAVATLVVLEFPSLKLVYECSQVIELTVPYIPSFLSLRESPHLLSLLDQLRSQADKPFPQILMVDGNGRLHTRAAGLATVVGVLSDIPSLGVGKDYYALPPPPEEIEAGAAWRNTQRTFKAKAKESLKDRGDWIGIYNGTEKDHFVGAALLSSPDRKSTNPVYVSEGHRIGLETAIRMAFLCCKEAKVPEPIRLADKAGRAEVEKLWGTRAEYIDS